VTTSFASIVTTCLRRTLWLSVNGSFEAVESTIETICRNPAIGAPRFLKHPKLAGLRSWPVSGFPMIRVYYIYASEDLRVVRILHGRRDVNAILEDEPMNYDS
jgi:plasmid stabilization system protein ParE